MGASLAIFAGAAYYGATGAFFSDTETSTGNTFTAGEVDLTISDLSHQYNGNDDNAPVFTDNGFSFSLDDLKPLDNGVVTYTLANSTNEAYLCAAVDETSNADNGVNDPESDAGDTTDGVGNGELGQFLSFKFGNVTGPLSALSGTWQSLGTIGGNTSTSSAIEYCFGTYVGGVCQPNATTTDENIAQTDSLMADVGFYVVQTRNNPNFSCTSLPPFAGESTLVEVNANDLAVAPSSTAWLFYNDTNDTVMTINQFSGTGGVNNIVAGPGSVGAAQMTLDSGVDPRYNIATYKYKNVKLSDITTLKYRVYDATSDSDTPYIHFNVDFNNSDTWQGRLVQVAAPLSPNTWTTVDPLAGTWTKTQGNWPAGLTSNGSLTGSTARTWAQIVADYPNAETRSTDSFLGIRVGQPGPVGATAYVDWIQFNNETTDFE